MHTIAIDHLSVKQLTTPHNTLAVAMTSITAKQARELVDQENKHLATNRTMSNGTIEAYRRDMIGGRWNGYNGEALKFNPEGKLIDGEHRIRGLSRVADDEFAQEFLVFFGVPDEARDTMDDGRKRSAADKFNLSHGAGKLGIKLTSALRALAIIGSGQGSGGRMSASALLQLYAKHPNMLDAVKTVMDVDKEDQVPVRPAVVTAMYYIAKELLGNDKLATDFLSVMQSGDKAYDGDPVHAWREFVIRKNAAGGKKLAEAELVRGTVKAFNIFAKGEKLAGKFSIPKDQPKVTDLTVKMVFDDMVEGYLASPAAPTSGNKPSKVKDEGETPSPASEGNGGTTQTTAEVAGQTSPLFLPDGSVDESQIGIGGEDDPAGKPKDTAAPSTLAKRAAAASKKAKASKGGKSADAVH